MGNEDKPYKFSTRTIHAGQVPDPSTGAIMPPIYATSTYVQQSPGVHKGFDYARSQNPTRFAYERCMADLESGRHGFAFASGMAAIATVLEVIDSGSHVVAMDDLYGGSCRLFDQVRRRSAGLTSVSPTCPTRPHWKRTCGPKHGWSGSSRRPTRCSSWWTWRPWPV